MYSCLLFVACHLIDMNIIFHLTSCFKVFFLASLKRNGCANWTSEISIGI